MNDGAVDFGIELRAWVASTSGSDVPVPSTEEVRRRLDSIRGPLSLGFLKPGSMGPTGETLTILSLLSNDLVTRSGAHESVRAEAGAAFDLISSLDWPADELGEVSELLGRFAFISWRHTRAMRLTRASQEWLEQFDQILTKGSTQRDCIDYFLTTPVNRRTPTLYREFLSTAEDLFYVCGVLRQRRSETPASLASGLPALAAYVESEFWPAQFSDEREYFLGQIEVSASACARWLGYRESSLDGLGRAADLYSTTVDRDINLAEVELLRLTIRYDMGEFDEVSSRLPKLQEELVKLGMESALVKSQILEGAAFKGLGRLTEAMEAYERAMTNDVLRANVGLRVFALEHLADTYTLQGRFDRASACLRTAMSLMSPKAGTVRAYLKMVVGEACRLQGYMEAALQSYREAQHDYDEIGIEPSAAYARLNAAEVLLLIGRDQEAEAEILLALPVIERCKMVREGLSALVLLRESLRRRKTDRNALRELREHLQGKR